MSEIFGMKVVERPDLASNVFEFLHANSDGSTRRVDSFHIGPDGKIASHEVLLPQSRQPRHGKAPAG